MNIPRQEHPFPQFVRENWLNLNGTWQFQIDHGRSGRERGFEKLDKLEGEILVPFCPESKLSGVEYKDFMACVWYRRCFTVPEGWPGRVLLHFGAVDYAAWVYVNGTLAGTHRGGYSSFTMDITDLLQQGENVLTLCAEDDTRSGLQGRGKQSEEFYSHGCDYTRTTGIWQTVWLEGVPDSYLTDVVYEPDAGLKSVWISGTTRGKGKVKALVSYEGAPMGEGEACSDGTFRMCVPLCEQHLWDVGQGRLYDVALSFGEDRVQSYFGLRRAVMDGEKFLLNGRSVFQRLILDQGFYPDGVYTAPCDEELRLDIQRSMDMGFNGARLHQKVFEPRFLYHCDKMGYLVWGEWGNWGMDHTQIATLPGMLQEWEEILVRDRSHPAIIGWCPFNETWDQHGCKQDDEILRTVYRTTKAIDPTRPCIDTSGNFHVETDVYDVHDYDQNPETFKAHYDLLMTTGQLYERFPERQMYTGGPAFVSEYGGIQWSSSGWGYGEAPKTEEEFLARYKGLTDALLDNSRMFGLCYTQLTDVEQEQNGLYTFDRRPKFDPKVICAITSRKAAIED